LEADLGAAHCAVGDGVNEAGSASDLGYGGNSSNNASSASLPIIYRLSIRVDGPRGTQAYFQATLTP
jgi:type IV pilus assembly protein PilX